MVTSGLHLHCILATDEVMTSLVCDKQCTVKGSRDEGKHLQVEGCGILLENCESLPLGWVKIGHFLLLLKTNVNG